MMKHFFKIIRYLISGGSAAVIDLGLLYLLVHWMKMHYLGASILAFLLAFIVSFTLQKYWTFDDASNEKVHHQVIVYLIVSVINLGINTLLIYLFVDFGHLHYLVSQVIAGALLAISSFFIYSIFIFKPSVKDSVVPEDQPNNL